MRKMICSLMLLLFLFTLTACSGVSSTTNDDINQSSNSSPKSIFDFMDVNEDHVGIIKLEPGMTQDEVLESLGLDQDEVTVFEPSESIDSTRVYAQLDMESIEYPGFSWEAIFYFMEDAYVRTQLTASCYDIDLDVVNQYVNDTVEMISEHLDNSLIHTSGDYDGSSQMNGLGSNCTVQWEVDGDAPISISFALQDTSANDAVGYDNVFSASFHVT